MQGRDWATRINILVGQESSVRVLYGSLVTGPKLQILLSWPTSRGAGVGGHTAQGRSANPLSLVLCKSAGTVTVSASSTL